MKTYFPIKTNPACQFKWTWSSLYLYTGQTNSCHRIERQALTPETIEDFHNLPKKIADRELMLSGQWPTGGCEYCKKIEDVGGVSDRLMQLNVPGLSPPELDHDINAVHVTPRIVEVYFDNLCNMSCVYCSDIFSSKIQQENNKFGRFEKNGLVIDNVNPKNPNFEELTEKFWGWLDKNYATIRRFHIVGGEPFYQKQFDTYIEFLESRKNTELELTVISNLMVDHDRLVDRINKIKRLVAQRKIKRFDLTCSIDCWGTEQEYIRQGLNLEHWKKNFEYVVNQKWIVVNINQVVSALSIPSMTPLLEYLNQQRACREIGHHLISVTEPTYLNPDIFGPGMFDSYFEDILAIMPEETWQQQQIKQYMHGVQMQIANAPRQHNELVKLRTYLDELDRRRNTNWRSTFPWLVKELENVV